MARSSTSGWSIIITLEGQRQVHFFCRAELQRDTGGEGFMHGVSADIPIGGKEVGFGQRVEMHTQLARQFFEIVIIVNREGNFGDYAAILRIMHQCTVVGYAVTSLLL